MTEYWNGGVARRPKLGLFCAFALRPTPPGLVHPALSEIGFVSHRHVTHRLTHNFNSCRYLAFTRPPGKLALFCTIVSRLFVGWASPPDTFRGANWVCCRNDTGQRDDVARFAPTNWVCLYNRPARSRGGDPQAVSRRRSVLNPRCRHPRLRLEPQSKNWVRFAHFAFQGRRRPAQLGLFPETGHRSNVARLTHEIGFVCTTACRLMSFGSAFKSKITIHKS